MGVKEAEKAALKAEGYLSLPEGRLLYNLARKCKGKGAIVEIGSWKGRSTIWIAYGSRDGKGAKVVAIDPHTSSPGMPQGNSFDEFKSNLKNAGVEAMVKPVVKTSEAAAASFNEPVEFVFIDGDHSYKFAKQDFELWFPKVMNHGIMAFHDTMLVDGPKKVVGDKVFGSKNFRNIGFADSITFAEKVEQNTFPERLHNSQVFLLKQVFSAVSKFNIRFGLPKPIKAIGKKLVKLLQ